MRKMHLAGRVPNEGARRLAWWIGDRFRGDLVLASLRIGQSASTLDRLLGGEIVPGGELAASIIAATRGEIIRTDWQRPAQGGWFERPQPRQIAKAA